MDHGETQVVVGEAVARLETAAWTAGLGWLPERWTVVGADEPTDVALRPLLYLHEIPCGVFEGLDLVPGRSTTVETDVDVPVVLAGVPTGGEPLEMALYSVYPTHVAVDGRAVFDDRTPPVAVGPALFPVVEALPGGPAGRLALRVDVPEQQRAAGWLHLRLTTPGLRRRFDQLDLVAAQLRLASAVVGSAGEAKALHAAALLVPVDPLALTPDQLGALVDEVQDRLTPLAPRIAELDVHLVGHSHIDLAWLWTWEDTCEVVKRDASSVLDLLDDYPEMTFTHSQPATYEVLRDQAPELYERVLGHVASGRWEPATIQWVEADTNMPSGEAAVRQLVEGVAFSEDELGTRPRVHLAPDTFGHAGNLPQLSVSAGARVYYHHRANPGTDRGEGLWPAYWWEGQDGTRLLAVSTPQYLGDLTASGLAKALVGGPIRAGQRVALHFYGIGDHGGGPTRQSLDRARAWRRLAAFPRVRCSTVEAYARDLEASGAALPVHRGESARIFEGCYTTHADSKRLNRDAESALVTAQTLAASAGLQRRGELSEAWRGVLFHQFHDILDGSATREAYEKDAEDCLAAVAAAERVTDDALAALHAGVGGDVVVTNPLGVTRTDVVVVAGRQGSGPVTVVEDDGRRVPAQWTADGLCFVTTVGPFASRGYRVEAGGEWADVELGRPDGVGDPTAYRTVRTTAFDLVVREDSGIVTSLVDRRSGRSLVGYGMRRGSDYVDTARADLALNVLTATTERPLGMSAWHLDELAVEEHLLRGASTTVLESGPVRVVLEVRRQWRSSTVVQHVVAYRDLPRVDLRYLVDWQEVGSPADGVPGLKAVFTARLPEVEAWFETPYAAVRRPSDGQESPALRWAAVGGPEGGIAVLNDSKHGYDALGGRLRVTLLRSAFDPDAESDTGAHDVRLALLPYVGDWRGAGVVDEAAGFNQPLLGRWSVPSAAARDVAAWRPVVSPGPVRVGTLDVARSGGARVVRLYEAHGVGGSVTVSGLGQGASAWEASVTEDRLRPLDVRAGEVSLVFRPWQVRTLLVEGA